ncbi:hypothetical protein [Streptomyces sp. enrichment culture]|uniref:hypothetical protein n=1 Tax=Streptomyces sp. enrichment culture TaxID=1795815 RepID=UPI003F557843
MLSEAMTALAAAGGTAVVQAAGTDAWLGLRERVARLLGRGDEERRQVQLERLDRTAAALTAGGSGVDEQTCTRQEAAWQERFEMLLESLGEDEREAVGAELRSIIDKLPGPVEVRGVHNEISGGTQYGTVIQGRDFHGPIYPTLADPGRRPAE